MLGHGWLSEVAMEELPERRKQSGSLPWLLRLGALALVIALWLTLRGGADVPRETELTGAEMPAHVEPPAPAPATPSPASLPPGAPSASREAAPVPQGKPGGANAATCLGDLNCPAHQLCTRGSCGEIDATTTECNAITLHFEGSATDVSAQDEMALERAARCLKAERAPKLQLVETGAAASAEGSARQRASVADLRAKVVEERLTQKGVTAAQLRAIGRSEDTAGCPKDDAVCLERKRRTTRGTP